MKNKMKRFRLTTVLMLIAIVAVVCGWLIDRSRLQKQSLAELETWRGYSTLSLAVIQIAQEDKTNLEFVETPLNEALAYIGDKHKIIIQYDVPALKEVAIDPRTIPCSLNVHNVTFHSALRMLLHEHKLAFIEEDEVLKIVPAERADKYFTTKVYDVHELLPQADASQVNQLVKTITETITPANWKVNGGGGDVQPFLNNGKTLLVVLQNPAGHEQISALLGNLSAYTPAK